jgi:DNA-binding IclR family transcriptional regulator
MDFSEYTGPSDEWIALERDLPADVPDLDPNQLKDAVNKAREEGAARELIEQGELLYTLAVDVINKHT